MLNVNIPTCSAPGYCSHIVGLFNTLDLMQVKDSGTPLEPQASTSLPQQWHKPRGTKLKPVPVSSACAAKAKVTRKRKPVDCHYSGNQLVYISVQ